MHYPKKKNDYRPVGAAGDREASMAESGRRGEWQVHEIVQIKIKNFMETDQLEK